MRVSSSNSSRLLVAVLVTVALVLVILKLVIGHHDDAQQSTQTSATPSSTPVSPASQSASPSPSTASLSIHDLQQLSQRVKLFSAAFYSLNASTSADTVKQAVARYATDSFMATTQFGFGNSAADQAMEQELQEGTSLQVVAISSLVGPYISPTIAQGDVTLQITKKAANGSIVTSYTKKQNMIWVKQNETWLVQQAPRT